MLDQREETFKRDVDRRYKENGCNSFDFQEQSRRSLNEIDFTGGDSVYCINEKQLKTAYEMTIDKGELSEKINSFLETLENLSRNEQAAIAFVMIDRLLKGND